MRSERGELERDGELVRITDRERDMLTLLGNANGAPVAREALAGRDVVEDSASLRGLAEPVQFVRLTAAADNAAGVKVASS